MRELLVLLASLALLSGLFPRAEPSTASEEEKEEEEKGKRSIPLNLNLHMPGGVWQSVEIAVYLCV